MGAAGPEESREEQGRPEEGEVTYLRNPLPEPPKREHREMDFDLPYTEGDDFDLDISDEDDFDI